VSSFLFGLTIAVANAAWSAKIEQNKKEKLDKLMTGLIYNAKTFEIVLENLEVPYQRGKTTATNVYKALDSAGQCVGFSFVASGPGFADKIELVVATDGGFEHILGYNVLSCSETPGFGDKIKTDYYRSQFSGPPAESFTVVKTGDSKLIDNQIVAISGATVSSAAVVKIFNTYIEQIKKQLQTKGLIK